MEYDLQIHSKFKEKTIKVKYKDLYKYSLHFNFDFEYKRSLDRSLYIRLYQLQNTLTAKSKGRYHGY